MPTLQRVLIKYRVSICRLTSSGGSTTFCLGAPTPATATVGLLYTSYQPFR